MVIKLHWMKLIALPGLEGSREHMEFRVRAADGVQKANQLSRLVKSLALQFE